MPRLGVMALRFVVLATALSGARATPRGVHGEAFHSDRIAVTTVGGGPDVVLLGGLTASAEDVWSGTVAAVPGYRYHLVQVRGFADEVREFLQAQSSSGNATASPARRH